MEPPLVSVFTPSHNVRYLDDAYYSLAAQTHPDWEWIVLINGRVTAWKPPEDDKRVRVVRAPAQARGIGALKRAACAQATGEILLELDHDDMLTSECLSLIVGALADPDVSLAYSDWAQVDEHGEPDEALFDPAQGWTYSRQVVDGRTVDVCQAMAPTPHNVGYIWFAPNHVRAFRRSLYEAVGGYDAGREVADDHELMIRLYQVGAFRHVPRCGYLQRMHAENTQRKRRLNAQIQQQTQDLYLGNIESLALAWAGREHLACVRLLAPIAEPVEPDDRFDDVMLDPEDPSIPVETSSVAVVKADDVLHRVPRRAELYNEIYRVLAHAGLMLSNTPSTDGRGAFQDPTSAVYYNENSFIYLTQERLKHMIPGHSARWQGSHLRTYFPTEWHEELDIAYVQANLLAVKDGSRQGGPIL